MLDVGNGKIALFTFEAHLKPRYDIIRGHRNAHGRDSILLMNVR